MDKRYISYWIGRQKIEDKLLNKPIENGQRIGLKLLIKIERLLDRWMDKLLDKQI